MWPLPVAESARGIGARSPFGEDGITSPIWGTWGFAAHLQPRRPHFYLRCTAPSPSGPPDIVSGYKYPLAPHSAQIRAETHASSRWLGGSPGVGRRSARPREALRSFWRSQMPWTAPAGNGGPPPIVGVPFSGGLWGYSAWPHPPSNGACGIGPESGRSIPPPQVRSGA